MPNWCTAKVVERKVWADGLFTLTVETDEVRPFEAGQFLHLALGDEENRVNRPYSVASPHGNQLEFFIVRVDDGELTPRLWNLEVGDSIEVSDRGAGSFTLKKSPDAEILWLVSTGTGLAPYIAMLRTSQPWERYEKIVVVHGVRFAADLAYTQELRELESKYAGRFKMVQCLTRETSDDAMHGRIPKLLEDGQLESEMGWQLRKDNSTVLLCGNPAMLDDMEQKLGQRDMSKHRTKAPGQIVLERYW